MKIVAVSGGVDSMVLLDFCVRKFGSSQVVVAHFNHGTRKSCKDDEEFVKNCCKNYNVLLEVGYGKLGENVSEEIARKKRYEFFEEICEKYQGELYVAHHLDDLIESVCINFIRGTGWRGLNPMANSLCVRPFIEADKPWTRRDILIYGAKNEIVFREDPTNSSENYLRNRIRKSVREMELEKKLKIFELWKKQRRISKEISECVEKIISNSCEEFLASKKNLPKNVEVFPRELFSSEDLAINREILKKICEKNNIKLTRPQMDRCVFAIKNFRAGKKFDLNAKKFLRVREKYFFFE